MGFLTTIGNIFTSNKNKEYSYFERAYNEMKTDKEQLKLEVKGLNNQILILNKQLIELLKYNQPNTIITTDNTQNTSNNNIKTIDIVSTEPGKLAPKEKFILKLCDDLRNYDDVLANSKMKDSSLKVYFSRIRKKNYKIAWENNE